MSAERFVVDGMLGSLARWLRILGVDTLYPRGADDDRLLEIAEEDGRILLTRDRPLAGRASRRRGVRVHLVGDGLLDAQLSEVLGAFGLEAAAETGGYTRCSLCNTLLEEADRERARARVPPYVARTQRRFLHCPACDKFYWAATHVEQMRRRLARLSRKR